MPPGGCVLTGRDPKGSRVLLSTPKATKGFPSRTQRLKNASNIACSSNASKIKPPNHETDPIHTKSKFYVKALRFLKLKGEEEEGQCGEFGGRFKLGSNLQSQRNP